MSVKQRLMDDMKAAMKARDEGRVSIIRMINADIKNKEIEVGREIEDAETYDLIAKEVKELRHSAAEYRKASRIERADQENAEIAILMEYLPEQLDENRIGEMAKEAVAETGASSMKDMGRVMSLLMPKVKGKADGAAVNRIVKELLGG